MYNIFKRPMFKRGGSTTGTGIMSHVEPRIHAANGWGSFGSTFAKPTPTGPNFSLVGKPYATPSNLPMTIPQAPGISNLRYISGGTGLAALTFAPTAAMASYLYGPEAQKADEIIGMYGEAAPEDVLNEASYYLGDPGRRRAAVNQKIALDEEVRRRKAQAAGIESLREDKGNGETGGEEVVDTSKKPTYEDSMKAEIRREADMLKDLLGPDMTTAEKALFIAEVAGTPGSLTDKLDVARKKGLEIAADKRKQDRSAILTSYKYAKEKQAKEAELSSNEKLVEGYVKSQLKKPGNTKSAEQIRSEAYEQFFGKQEKEFYTAALAKGLETALPEAQADIVKYNKKIQEGKNLSSAEQAKYKQAQDTIKRYRTYAEQAGIDPRYLGFKDGGRVKYAMGTDENGAQDTTNQLEATNIVQDDQSVPMKPVTKVNYQDLRSRLPKEITNDIVQLLSTSEEALQDFAYIKSQSDVNSFNVKYGVNLILPPGTI